MDPQWASHTHQKRDGVYLRQRQWLQERRREDNINNRQLGSERYKVEASVVEIRIQCLEGKRDEMGGYTMRKS